MSVAAPENVWLVDVNEALNEARQEPPTASGAWTYWTMSAGARKSHAAAASNTAFPETRAGWADTSGGSGSPWIMLSGNYPWPGLSRAVSGLFDSAVRTGGSFANYQWVARLIAESTRPTEATRDITPWTASRSFGSALKSFRRTGVTSGRPPVAHGGRVQLITKWDGVVLGADENTLRVRLTDESGQQPEVEARLLISEVPEADRELIRKNALFYWTIGYRDTPTGDRVRESRIRFRRLPGWKPEDLERADAWAENTRQLFGWT